MEQLSAIEMLPTKFSPKWSNNFILSMDGLEAFMVKKITLPKWTAKEGEALLLSNLEIDLFDPIAPCGASQVMEVSLASSLKPIKIEVKLMDPMGTVIKVWRMTECKVLMVDFGKLDYDVKKPIVIHVEFSVDKMLIDPKD